MSRLWDTPDFWARGEADDMLREMPHAEPAALADALEHGASSYDDGPEMAALIVADLRRRAAVGTRFWTGPQSIDVEGRKQDEQPVRTGRHSSISAAPNLAH